MSESWERDALQDLLTASLKEQRRARRWGIFFKLLTFAYATGFILMVFGLIHASQSEVISTEPHTALVRLQGVIAPGREGTDSSMLVDGLKAAFDDKNTRAVILQANSPGGSPVQSGIVYDEIQRLRKAHPKVPLYVVVEDVCASGCYYIAAAADKIYADKASIVGSIGVLMDGFGFTGAMDKLGVQRRLLTAGSNKGFLDPFSPLDEGQKAKAQVMLDEIHQQFITAVKQGRGKRLQDGNPDLFSGMVWSGATGKQLGLVDELGSVDSVARDVIKVEKLVDFTPQDSLADRLARQIGVSAATQLSTHLQPQLR
ncbi:S49 family peptidase [Chitinilyticum piscinae]|uniref:S49 family peptidase n=1 Tax=Chitinilyticum piscinae TaxID=2866724 RepID=A0A8J7FZH7_9NEIS|nr:S49 family peptidase [Chitinilyticum piscinae]MBE9608558.1 S49 family peptidase [Chitinilyticum piscinae]